MNLETRAGHSNTQRLYDFIWIRSHHTLRPSIHVRRETIPIVICERYKNVQPRFRVVHGSTYSKD